MELIVVTRMCHVFVVPLFLLLSKIPLFLHFPLLFVPMLPLLIASHLSIVPPGSGSWYWWGGAMPSEGDQVGIGKPSTLS